MPHSDLRKSYISQINTGVLRLLGTLIVDMAVVLQLIFWFVQWANWLGVISGIFLIPGVLIFRSFIGLSKESSPPFISR